MGIVLGILGLVTGSIWARFTWGSWWVNDPKLKNGLERFKEVHRREMLPGELGCSLSHIKISLFS